MGDEVRNQANYQNGNLLESYKAYDYFYLILVDLFILYLFYSLNNLIPIGVVMPWLRNKYLGKLFSYEKRRLEAATQSNAFIKDVLITQKSEISF